MRRPTLIIKDRTPGTQPVPAHSLFGWLSLLCSLSLCSLSLSSSTTWAEAAADTVSPASSSQPALPLPEPGAANTPTKISAYHTALLAYETEGPYHQNASEVLYSLGLELQRSGQHNKALTALHRAMHINRVNDGLSSLSQAPMLRSIINSQKSLVQIESVTTSYHQLLNMHIATYGRQDPRNAPLLNELGLWHLDAYQFDESDTRIDHLTSAYSLVVSALQLSEANPNTVISEHIELLRSAALVNFYLSRHEGDQWSSSTSSHYSLSANGFATTNPQRTGILSGASFRRGRVCHERIVELTADNPEASQEDKIQAQTELADWYLLFNHKTEAMARYQQVLTQISTSEQSQTLYQQIFLTPRLLPALRMEKSKATIGGLFIMADMDISEKGWGRDINNLAEGLFPGQSPSNDKSIRYKMMDTIKHARFRPLFVDNKPTDVSDVSVQIPLIH